MRTKDVYADVRKQLVRDWHVHSCIAPAPLYSTEARGMVAHPIAFFNGEVSLSRGALGRSCIQPP